MIVADIKQRIGKKGCKSPEGPLSQDSLAVQGQQQHKFVEVQGPFCCCFCQAETIEAVGGGCKA